MLTIDQLRKLIELTQEQTAATFDGYVVKKLVPGYATDPELAQLQGALSIMLEAAARRTQKP